MGWNIFEKSVAMLLMLSLVLGGVISFASMRNTEAAYADTMIAGADAQTTSVASPEIGSQAMIGCLSVSQCKSSKIASSSCGNCALNFSGKAVVPDSSEIRAVHTTFLVMSDRSTTFSLLKPPRA